MSPEGKDDGPSGGHQGGTYELELAARDVGDVHVVGRGGKVFELLAGEDVDGNHVDLGVTVLASLGGGHVDDLARAALNDNVTVLPQGRALHGEGGGGASISGGIKGVLVLLRRKSATAWPLRAVYHRGQPAPDCNSCRGAAGACAIPGKRTCASSAIVKI